MPAEKESSTLQKAKRFGSIAFDPEVLKVAVPAYCLPLADLGLSALGLDVLRGVWFWLFGPAVGLHALITASVASRVSTRPAAQTAPADLKQTQDGLEA